MERIVFIFQSIRRQIVSSVLPVKSLLGISAHKRDDAKTYKIRCQYFFEYQNLNTNLYICINILNFTILLPHVQRDIVASIFCKYLAVDDKENVQFLSYYVLNNAH